jgi:LPS-assembly lipoprotein
MWLCEVMRIQQTLTSGLQLAGFDSRRAGATAGKSQSGRTPRCGLPQQKDGPVTQGDRITRRWLPGGLLALSLIGAATLSACTGLTPVYSDPGANSAMALNFAAPNTPLEQIVYQDLARRFGLSQSPDAPKVSVTVSTATRDIGQSVTTDPANSELLTATGVLRITRNGQPVLTTTRQATATYSSDSQVLADNAAATAAGEQAAHALADTLELTIMSALAPTAPPA